MKSVYIETTIPSYLAAWPSRDLIQAARQQLTHDWWNSHRADYELLTSQLVVDEAAGGDADAAGRRLDILEGLPLLDFTSEVEALAFEIMASGLLPDRASDDSLHIAVATIHQIDFLLTWNCKHIANAFIMKELRMLVSSGGYELPTIATPEELLEV